MQASIVVRVCGVGGLCVADGEVMAEALRHQGFRDGARTLWWFRHDGQRFDMQYGVPMTGVTDPAAQTQVASSRAAQTQVASSRAAQTQVASSRAAQTQVASSRAAQTELASPPQPRQLIVSLYGLYARQHDNWLSVATVVRLMADLGVDDQAVRSSISRLKRRGLLEAVRVGGAAGYALSPLAREILADGDARIFGRRRATLADGWLLVCFSVPESERDKRHQLRTQLTRLGFGTVTPGVWVAPGNLEAETNQMLARLDVREYSEVFRGQHVAPGDLAEQVRRWWDLASLEQLYAAFLDRYRPVRQRWSRGPVTDTRAAFADYVEMLTAWRRLPYADPGLPLDLLPDGWSGVAAEELFTSLRETLAAPASAHALTVLGRN
jgi:phenylacetic acid degradation operon negative regulatory protein